MSIGLGHNYLVHLIKHFTGSLDECLKFMKENKPKDKYSWFELRPLVEIKKGKRINCELYSCNLVEDGKTKL